MKEWNVSLVDEGWLFDKNFQSVDLNEYISIQNSIIVIIVLIFSTLLSEDCFKERDFGTER